MEGSFNNQVTKFRMVDSFRYHRIFQNGQSNWAQLCCLWDLQSFIYHLFVCSNDCGSQVSGQLGVLPPSVAEYLYSANNNLLIPIPLDEPDDHLAEEEGEYKYYF